MSDTATTAQTEGTSTVTIQGFNFSVADRYAEGHTLDAIEASVLNQTLRENIRNNFASTVKAAKEAAEATSAEVDVADLQSQLDDYVSDYSFQRKTTRSPRASADPVLREATKIAKAKVTEALKRKNIEKADLPEGKFDNYVAQVLERDTSIMEEARRRVNAEREIAMETVEDLLDSE